ncbi:hypothetical protein DL96DRAFT_1598591 [Flagelloscypha sp. PMI_526]|nr:hypothetical protein DL96DRAFT_1598591 [Flagelloscypha sp. PMI_526]
MDQNHFETIPEYVDQLEGRVRTLLADLDASRAALSTEREEKEKYRKHALDLQTKLDNLQGKYDAVITDHPCILPESQHPAFACDSLSSNEEGDAEPKLEACSTPSAVSSYLYDVHLTGVISLPQQDEEHSCLPSSSRPGVSPASKLLDPPEQKPSNTSQSSRNLDVLKTLRETYSEHIVSADVDPGTRVFVTRRWISAHIGGSSQSTTSRSRDGNRFLAFPLAKWNCVPSKIGDGGLIFALRYDLNDSTPAHSIFVKEEETGNRWEYKGEYKFSIVGRLTTDEANNFPRQIQDDRVSSLTKQGSQAIYTRARARDLVDKQVALIKNGNGGPLSPEEIRTALRTGIERPNIIKMIFERYDIDFARWIENLYSKTSESSLSASKVGKRSTQKRPTKKRRRHVTASDSESEDEWEISDNESNWQRDSGSASSTKRPRLSHSLPTSQTMKQRHSSPLPPKLDDSSILVGSEDLPLTRRKRMPSARSRGYEPY